MAVYTGTSFEEGTYVILNVADQFGNALGFGELRITADGGDVIDNAIVNTNGEVYVLKTWFDNEVTSTFDVRWNTLEVTGSQYQNNTGYQKSAANSDDGIFEDEVNVNIEVSFLKVKSPESNYLCGLFFTVASTTIGSISPQIPEFGENNPWGDFYNTPTLTRYSIPLLLRDAQNAAETITVSRNQVCVNGQTTVNENNESPLRRYYRAFSDSFSNLATETSGSYTVSFAQLQFKTGVAAFDPVSGDYVSGQLEFFSGFGGTKIGTTLTSQQIETEGPVGDTINGFEWCSISQAISDVAVDSLDDVLLKFIPDDTDNYDNTTLSHPLVLNADTLRKELEISSPVTTLGVRDVLIINVNTIPCVSTPNDFFKRALTDSVKTAPCEFLTFSDNVISEWHQVVDLDTLWQDVENAERNGNTDKWFTSYQKYRKAFGFAQLMADIFRYIRCNGPVTYYQIEQEFGVSKLDSYRHCNGWDVKAAIKGSSYADQVNFTKKVISGVSCDNSISLDSGDGALITDTGDCLLLD